MKIKFSHVTNSSSCSFIIADISGKKDNPILYHIGADKVVNLRDFFPMDEIPPQEFYDYIDETEKERFENFINNNPNAYVYTFGATDQSSSVLEVGICRAGISQEEMISNKIIVIRGEGGY